METKKQFMYVINHPTIRSNTHAAFFLWSYVYVLCFLKSLFSLSFSLPNLHLKCQECLVQNVRIMSGMLGISNFRLEWQTF